MIDEDPNDMTLTREVGRVLRDIRLLVTEGVGDEAEIMTRKLDILARIEAHDAARAAESSPSATREVRAPETGVNGPERDGPSDR